MPGAQHPDLVDKPPPPPTGPLLHAWRGRRAPPWIRHPNRPLHTCGSTLTVNVQGANLTFVMCVAQHSSLDVLVLVGEVGVRAGLLTINKLLHKASCCT